MVYTNAVPQGNQKISQTQLPIQQNFDYLQKAIGQEHNMVADDTDPTHTYHLQASMPNAGSASPTLPAGTNGMYYVYNSLPRFKTVIGPTPLFLQYSAILSYIFFSAAQTIPANPGTLLLTAVPGNCVGTIWLNKTDDSTVYAVGTFTSSSTQVVVHQDHGLTNIILGQSGLNLYAGSSTGSSHTNINVQIQLVNT